MSGVVSGAASQQVLRDKSENADGFISAVPPF